MIPLAEIGFNWRSHKAAVAWLWLLYRRPSDFQEAVRGLPRRQALRGALSLCIHGFPYVFLVSMTLSLGLEMGLGHDLTLGLVAAVARRTAVGIAVGIAGGIAVGIANGIAFGIAGGIAGGIAVGIAGGIAGGIANGIALGIAVGIAFGIAVGIAFGIAGGIANGIAFGIASLRAYYIPFSIFWVWPRLQPGWYRYHPAAWDNMCSIPYPRLDRLLVACTEQAPGAGWAEIERIVENYPAQADQALRATVTLLARKACEIGLLTELPVITAQLPQGAKGYLAQCDFVRDAAEKIVQLQIRLDTMDRPLFRQPTAELVVKEIQSFGHRAAGFDEPLKTEFRKAAAQWEGLAQTQLDHITGALQQEPVQQFFRAGDPVDRNREAFIPRNKVTGELEQQIMLSTGCPGVILYGRRRVGKSTVLRNLDGFLPTNVRVAYLSAQSPELSISTESFVAAIGKAASADATPPEDLRGLLRVLAVENDKLTQAGQRLVLAIDEYEMLDRKIGAGVFTTDLLDTLRESIQTHRAITWILAGSHQITELPNAPWTSYLVSARLIEVPLFTLAETRMLLTSPAQYSTLWPKDSPLRPGYPAGFWGDGGIEKIQEETGGWPHLVQLVAETCVDLLNDQAQSAVNATILEQAFEKSVVRGEAVFYELLRRESRLVGEWEYLERFQQWQMQSPPEDAAIARSLKRRELVLMDGERWRLRVPLMRRWLVERG